MADQNNTNKPDITSNYATEVLDTLRGHILRLWKSDWAGMGGLVAGMRRWLRVGGANVKLTEIDAQGVEQTIFDSSLKADVATTPKQAARIDVASAATLDLTVHAPNTDDIQITGTTTITQINLAAGRVVRCKMAATCIFRNSANLFTNVGSDISIPGNISFMIRATANNVVELLLSIPRADVAGNAITSNNASSSQFFTQSSNMEAIFGAQFQGQPLAYFYNNGNSWGMQSPAGGLAFYYNRATGKFIFANDGVGINQTWQDVTTLRSINTNYTNVTGKPITVSVNVNLYNGDGFSIYINGSLMHSVGSYVSGIVSTTLSIVVPPNSIYRVVQNVSSGFGNISKWSELL